MSARVVQHGRVIFAFAVMSTLGAISAASAVLEGGPFAPRISAYVFPRFDLATADTVRLDVLLIGTISSPLEIGVVGGAAGRVDSIPLAMGSPRDEARVVMRIPVAKVGASLSVTIRSGADSAEAEEQEYQVDIPPIDERPRGSDANDLRFGGRAIRVERVIHGKRYRLAGRLIPIESPERVLETEIDLHGTHPVVVSSSGRRSTEKAIASGRFVQVVVIVGRDGTVTDVTMSKERPDISAQEIAALVADIRRWRYRPATVRGQPVTDFVLERVTIP